VRHYALKEISRLRLPNNETISVRFLFPVLVLGANINNLPGHSDRAELLGYFMSQFSQLGSFAGSKKPNDSTQSNFERLIGLASFICQAPMAAITLVDKERHWLESTLGLSNATEDITLVLCNHTLQAAQPCIIGNLAEDSSLPREEVYAIACHVQFYVGIPLVLHDGTPVGVLCVMDAKPREIDKAVIEHLKTLAQQLIGNLELTRQMVSLDGHLQFNQFANAMPVMVWTGGADGQINYGNKVFCDYVGANAQDFREGQAWENSLHPDDLASALKAWNDSVASGRTYLIEFRIRRYDGMYRWHQIRAVPIRADVNKEITRWLGTAIDIHDRNISAANSDRLAARLGSILESMTDAFFTLDRNWQFTYLNNEAERLLCRSRGELIGKNVWQEFPESVGTPFEHNYRLAMSVGTKVSFETFYPPLNSWISVNAHPSREGLTIHAQNTTELRRSQEQLKLLETCVAHMNDMVIITDAESQNQWGSRILFVNNAFIHRTGYSREEVVGQSRSFLHGPNTQPETLLRIHSAMQNGEPIREELINYTKDGKEIWLDIDYVPIADSQGNLTHWVAVKRDITGRKKAEEEHARIIELEQAQQLAELASQTKSHFLATMSHEIRTPISGVIGMVEVLHQTSLQAHQLEMVDIIQESTLSLLGIIDDILDFSKIEAGKLDIESMPVNLFGLLKSVCNLLDHFAANKGVELTLFCDPTIPETVLGDNLRLRQVLLNLINNAIKFSSGPNQNGHVDVQMQTHVAEADTVVVDFIVIDNGIGMDEETLARLFKPFVQADASTTRHFGGTGLGLTISRNLVQLMGGEITVASEPGVGSTFRVRLSFERAMGSECTKPLLQGMNDLYRPVLLRNPPLSEDFFDNAVRQNKFILVAEDNETNQKVIVHQLALLGYAADVVSNGHEALMCLQKKHYSLLITDLHMPEMDGYELVKRIRADDAQEYLPIIVSSANALRGEEERCRALGIDCYLTKPASLAQLQQAIECWLPHEENSCEIIADSQTVETSAAPIDLSVLKNLVGDEEDVVEDFLEAFGKDILLHAKDFRSAIATKNLTTLASLAHKLKSSARSVGALKLGAVCAELELAAKDGDIGTVKALIVILEHEFKNVNQYLASR
jgi:PAS domain S-box-containing protein